ncbi:MAG: hypothetical protein ACJ741_06875 [Pyrinomonadaceae bacterium]
MPTDRSTHTTARRRRCEHARRLASHTCRALVCVALVACAALAQSGRRQPKHEEVPPVTAPTPEPPAAKPKQEALKRIPIVVFIDNSLSVGTSSTAREIVTQSFGQRLREADAFDISTDTSSHASRGDAQRRARAEQERFVVWMTLRTNGMTNDQLGSLRPNPEDYHIEFAVFEPTTGKTRSSGSVYMRAGYGSVGGVAVGVPRCYPATYSYEYEFVVGAIDAANRVYHAFDIPPPPVCG